jgi:WhiB family redox-sensing transcriptional regulator
MNMNDFADYEYEEWREGAACADDTAGIFFPDEGDVGAIQRAKSICAECPVAGDCLSYAIETNQSVGIWGATTPRERRKLKRQWIEEIRRAS